MVLEKKPLSVEELESQIAIELPDREMMALLTIIIGSIRIPITIRDVDVAFAICANILAANSNVTCTVT